MASLGLARPGEVRPQLVDLGCGWGHLGLALALRVPGLRVVGLDLDGELLAAGRGLVDAMGLAGRVRLRKADVEEAGAWRDHRADAVVCQALLAHLPRVDDWLAAGVAQLAPGTRFAAVERDALEAAEAVRDGVTDGDPGYRGQRVASARAVVEGARRSLGVDRRVGSRLTGLLAGAGLEGVSARPLDTDLRLSPPYDPGADRAGWWRGRLERRRQGGVDLVDQSLAASGGMAPDRHAAWCAARVAADGVRLRALGEGRYRRDERVGYHVAWGVRC